MSYLDLFINLNVINSCTFVHRMLILVVMALAVDRFGLLEREILSILHSTRDVLAVVGSIYAAKKVLLSVYELCKTFGTYSMSSFGSPDLTRQYGKWAGITSNTFYIYILVVIYSTPYKTLQLHPA